MTCDIYKHIYLLYKKIDATNADLKYCHRNISYKSMLRQLGFLHKRELKTECTYENLKH